MKRALTVNVASVENTKKSKVANEEIYKDTVATTNLQPATPSCWITEETKKDGVLSPVRIQTLSFFKPLTLNQKVTPDHADGVFFRGSHRATGLCVALSLWP